MSNPELASPEKFPRVETLGRGSTGRVFLCHEKGTNKVYAVKTFRKSVLAKREKQKDVMNERNILARLNHPFVNKLHFAFEDAHPDGRLYLVMEFCPGGELFTALREREGNRLKEDDARFYASEILLGIEYLHSQGVCYRDLKPENVMLSRAGHVRLSDFDLSKVHDDFQCKPLPKDGEGPQSYNTRVRLRMRDHVGTLQYVAPEVLCKKAYDDMADWWSFGIVLYEMVFGRSPFARMDRVDAAAIIKKGTVTYPNIPVSAECMDLLRKLLQANPSKRLGNRHGAADIKAHPWFAGVNFATLRSQRPPVVPELDELFDTRYFVPPDDEEDVREAAEPGADDPRRMQTHISKEGDVYHGFYFERGDRGDYGEEGEVKRPSVSHVSNVEKALREVGKEVKLDNAPKDDPELLARLQRIAGDSMEGGQMQSRLSGEA